MFPPPTVETAGYRDVVPPGLSGLTSAVATATYYPQRFSFLQTNLLSAGKFAYTLEV